MDRADDSIFLQPSDEENTLITITVERGIINVTTVKHISNSCLIDERIHLCAVVFPGWRHDCFLWNHVILIHKHQAQVNLNAGFCFTKDSPLILLQAKSNGCRIDDLEIAADRDSLVFEFGRPVQQRPAQGEQNRLNYACGLAEPRRSQEK